VSATPPSIFCRRCAYPLDAGRGRARCPECACGYDPADRASYHTEEEVRAAAPVERLRRSPLAWLVVLAPFSGAADGYFFQAFGTAVITGVLVSSFALAWCNRDSHARGIRLRDWHVVAVFLLPVVAVPVYLVRSRRLRGLAGIPIMGLLLVAVGALAFLGREVLAAVAGP
jgi:hypothetical protein